MKRLFNILLLAVILFSASVVSAAPLTRLEPISGASVLRDDTYLRRWYDAWGPSVCKYIQDFVSLPVDDTTGDAVEFTNTIVEAGTGDTVHAITGEAGGVLLITTAANEDDGINMQLKGEMFKFTTDKLLYFGCRFKLSATTQNDILIGLSITDTEMLGGVTDGVYFRKPDGSTNISFVTEKDASETATVVANAGSGYHTLEFFFDGTQVYAFSEGVQFARHTATIPDDEELTVSLQYIAGEAVAKTASIDWIRCIQLN